MTETDNDPTDKHTSRDDSRFVAKIRDWMLGGVALIMAWSVHELYTLSNKVTAIDVDHVTTKDTMEMERRFNTLISVDHTATETAMSELRTTMAIIAKDTAKIAGYLEARDSTLGRSDGMGGSRSGEKGRP